MDQIQFALQQLRQDPQLMDFTDEQLISMYGLNRPSFTQGNTGILSNVSFPEFNLPNLGNIKNLGGQIVGGITSAVTGIPFLGPILSNIANPAVSDVIAQNYMAQNYGLDNIGRVQTGIMAGYNPVNLAQTGMIESIDKRMGKILARKEAGKSYSQTNLDKLQDLQADLIANEKANTYAPVVTQQQKQYFSGGDGDANKSSPGSNIGSTQHGSSGMTKDQHAAFRMAKGGLASIL